MTEFLTRINIPQPDFTIDYSSGLFFMGSCFSDNIGNRMEILKFKVCHNPFGVVYNPLSIAKNLALLLDKDKFTASDLNFHNELWFSFSHYTLFSDPDKTACLEKINATFLKAKKQLKDTRILLLTLGTSWAYQYDKTGNIVSNCHKIPSVQFTRIFSSVENTVTVLYHIIQRLRLENPNLKVIFTVSPVRHWKDGAIENQRSKAALILAINELEKRLDQLYYFPAYEIFMDELRDYRYYANDMIHPSAVAVDYIWKRFTETYFSPETHIILRNIEKIIKSLQHKPLHKGTKAYRQFQATLLKQMDELTTKYPFIDLKSEKENLEIETENN